MEIYILYGALFIMLVSLAYALYNSTVESSELRLKQKIKRLEDDVKYLEALLSEDTSESMSISPSPTISPSCTISPSEEYPRWKPEYLPKRPYSRPVDPHTCAYCGTVLEKEKECPKCGAPRRRA